MKKHHPKSSNPAMRAISVYALVSLFLFFEMVLQVSPSVISSQLMHSIGISAFGLGVMSGCYFYTYTLMQIPSGLLFDRYNPKSIIITSILILRVWQLTPKCVTKLLLCLFLKDVNGTWVSLCFCFSTFRN